MIPWLLAPLAGKLPVVGVFRYITFRAAMAALLALILSIVLGPALIRWLKNRQIGQAIREEGPKAHQAKAGTPTMGGVLINLAVALPTLLFADLSNRYVWVALAAMLLAMGVGLGDDWRKVSRQHNRGFSGRQKIVLQALIGAGVGFASLTLFPGRPDPTHLSFPFLKNVHPDVGTAGYLVFATVVVVGASNAVNLTDGLDGLAIGSTLVAAATLALLAYIAGNVRAATYLLVPSVPGTGELSVFLAALVGAALGFLWFNAHPAEVFMGDTGSLALGAALGTVAILIKQEILLVFVGGLFVVEALSVILQVGSFKLTGRRVFRMAPLHHHFELLGWAESKVIIRFWIIAILFALLSLSTLKLR
ncbi:MAG TPA: phospho-N-acetylmuramoyl-pentapeptide-transferase [Thermoanaerobaculia bacterium]|nr:phospho-N-acetylmuramoyl-pentapeptide-transferase [Thermoanaerobaculia bacterium]